MEDDPLTVESETNIDRTVAKESLGISAPDGHQHHWHLNRLRLSVLRSLVISAVLLVILLLLTAGVGALFYLVNRNGHTDSERYWKLKALEAEYNATMEQIVRMSKTAEAFENGSIIRALIRLKQLGQNFVTKDVNKAIFHHELMPNMSISMYYAVTLVSLIGYGEYVGASDLQYFCACFSMLIVVPVWYMYHNQLYHLFYYFQLYCHRRWFRPQSSSNPSMKLLWAIRIRNAQVYRSSRFYLSNFVIMVIMFPLCLSVFILTDNGLSFSDQLWLTLQSIFHVGLGDIQNKSISYWAVTFFMISTCFLIYFQCFSFILPQYPSMRLSRIAPDELLFHRQSYIDSR